MKNLSIIGAVIFFVGIGTCAHAVMPASHYQKLAEESKIKAIAIVEAVRLIDNGKRFSTQEAVFRPERAFAKNVPERFSGSCYSVLHKWQNPGVGGKIYFYPFSYNLLESAELHLKKSKKLKAMGKDPNRSSLYRYVETTDHSASYWVDEDRNLIRVAWDNDKEFIKTDKATATAAFP